MDIRNSTEARKSLEQIYEHPEILAQMCGMRDATELHGFWIKYLWGPPQTVIQLVQSALKKEVSYSVLFEFLKGSKYFQDSPIYTLENFIKDVERTLGIPQNIKNLLYIPEDVEPEASNRKCLQAHRGSYKTSNVSIVGPIWRLLFNPTDRLFIIRKNVNEAADTLKTISKIMKEPDIRNIFYMAHGIYPEFEKDNDRRLDFNFKSKFSKITTKEGSIEAYGVKTGITGRHCDFGIGDDFVTMEDRDSPAARQETKNFLTDLINNIVDPGKGFSFTGTPWHEDDAWNMLPVPLKFTPSDTNLLSEKQLQEKKDNMLPVEYAANYMLSHIAADTAIFSTPNMDRWRLGQKQQAFAQLDAGFKSAGKLGQNNTAMSIMRKNDDKTINGTGYLWGRHVQDLYPMITELCQKYHVKELHIEDNADQGGTAKELRAYFAENDVQTNIVTYHENMNKISKIKLHLYGYWSKLLWQENQDCASTYRKANAAYMKGIKYYTYDSKIDDAPDSAASLLRRKFYISKKATMLSATYG